MKFRENKQILLIICLNLIIITSFIYYNCKDSNNSSTNSNKTIIYNKNKSFIKNQTISGITFTNIKCSYNGKDSLLSYTISNKTNQSIDLKNYKYVSQVIKTSFQIDL